MSHDLVTSIVDRPPACAMPFGGGMPPCGDTVAIEELEAADRYATGRETLVEQPASEPEASHA